MKRTLDNGRDGQGNRLERRYRELLARYQALVERANSGARTRHALQQLSWFALQRSTSALAMFRDGGVVLSNPRWRALASGRTAPKGWTVSDGTRQYDDLATLAAGELERLGPSKRAARLLRVSRRDGLQVLQVRVERITPPGEEAFALVLVNDITEELAREIDTAELREAVKKHDQLSALGRLAAGVAHDLGNTLSALALRVERLSNRAGVADRADLRAIEEAIDVMRLTLDRLDRFSGRRSRPLEPVDLAKVIRAAIDVAGLRANAQADGARAHITVALELPRRLPRVAGNAAELTNVFVNLLINGRDAMPDGGTLTIDAEAQRQAVVVRVRDEGPGFRTDQLERMFEPFFTTKGAGGSGLGLSLAYGLMAAIGGTIRAGNRQGGGAEVVLELPVARRRSVSNVGDGRARGLGVVRGRKRLQ